MIGSMEGINENQAEKLAEQARMLVSRLEKLPPDSRWARRSSGYRGNLIKRLEEIEQRQLDIDPQEVNQSLAELQRLVNWGFWILENAAREMLE